MPKYINVEKLHFPNVAIYDLMLDGEAVPVVRLDELRKLPSEDVAPVKRGKWIQDGDFQICSECGEEHEWGDYRAPFCDSCGAKMSWESMED